jgi:hypothetical protein
MFVDVGIDFYQTSWIAPGRAALLGIAPPRCCLNAYCLLTEPASTYFSGAYAGVALIARYQNVAGEDRPVDETVGKLDLVMLKDSIDLRRAFGHRRADSDATARPRHG